MAIEEIRLIDQLKSLMNEGMKSATIRDAANRVQTVYETHHTSEIGEPCIRTDIKYVDGVTGTSRKTIAYSEVVTQWPGFEIVQTGAGNDFDALL